MVGWHPSAVNRPLAEANPSQVCRLPAQHQPTFGALRFTDPSRPVPLLIHTAGVLAATEPPGVRRGAPVVHKEPPPASTPGRCSSQCRPPGRGRGLPPASVVGGHPP